ncbi:MAG: serine phosphatase RsbU (regulator of sigma subunit) [Cyclobacteriaceae bacterium]|jgi:serine phosphatase RsbU (regulator of sigma subunit)
MKLYSKITLVLISILILSGLSIYFLITRSAELESTTTLLLTGGVLVIAVVLSVLSTRLVLNPFIKLTKAAAEISKGNTDIEIAVEGEDEVGVLANQLKNATETLSRRIKEQQALFKRLELQKNKILRQKQLMEHRNFQIKESISYAKRIQRSLLPDINMITRLLKGAMILYRPKDMVSGDFYWFERVRKAGNDYLIIACADATGHGVPGAIMSIMGSNQLTNIIYYQNYLDPKKILARLDKAIKFELYREEQKDTKKEGMEIGIVVINLDEYTMEYAGVGIPLYLMREGELKIYKPVRSMAGGMDGEEREVENRIIKESIEMKKGDRMYLASDGFQDQFGGERDKKFMVKRFKDLIVESKDVNMIDQSALFAKRFDQWKGKRPQTDDVVLLGVEF